MSFNLKAEAAEFQKIKTHYALCCDLQRQIIIEKINHDYPAFEIKTVTRKQKKGKPTNQKPAKTRAFNVKWIEITYKNLSFIITLQAPNTGLRNSSTLVLPDEIVFIHKKMINQTGIKLPLNTEKLADLLTALTLFVEEMPNVEKQQKRN